jgi:hypothetical protein
MHPKTPHFVHTSSTLRQHFGNISPAFAPPTALSRPFRAANGAKTQRKRKILGADPEKLEVCGRSGDASLR